MSILARSALGIDVSDGTLKAVKLNRRGRRIQLRRAWRQAYYHEGGDPRARALDALETFLNRHPPGALPTVVISAPTRGAYSSTYLVPAMAPDKLAELVRYEVLNDLGVPPGDVMVRHHVRKGAVENEVHAYALRRDAVTAFRTELDRRRLPWDALETPGFALASFLELEMPRGRDRILLGVGELATELVLLTERGLWMRHLPLGLADDPDPLSLAERLTQEIGAAVSGCLPGGRPFAPHDLVLTEEGALDATFTGALRKATGLAITRVQTLQRIAAPARMAWDGQSAEQVLCMGKALGLALSGLDVGRFPCPVLSGSPSRESLRQLPAVSAAVVVASLCLVGLGLMGSSRVATLRDTLPTSLADEWQQLADASLATAAEHARHQATADALLAAAQARPAVFTPKRALAQAARVFSQPGFGEGRVENLFLSTPTAQRPGVMTVEVSTGEAEPEALGARLLQAFRLEFDQVELRPPEADPGRLTFEVRVP